MDHVKIGVKGKSIRQVDRGDVGQVPPRTTIMQGIGFFFRALLLNLYKMVHGDSVDQQSSSHAASALNLVYTYGAWMDGPRSLV